MAESSSRLILDYEKVKISTKETKKEQQDAKDVDERPSWLPDGWIMEVNRGDDGTIYRYYTSPISGLTFMMKSEVLEYLFSRMDERFLESKNCATHNKLVMTHEWLPNDWMIEVRAGGENIDKMFKFYVYPPAGVRLFSKEDVLTYINKSKITPFDTNGQCDTSMKDNILANVEFNPHSLPKGWVKELVFRKTENGVRKDPYYTDPVSNYSFRTRRSAMLYVQTGKIPKRAFIQRTRVHDLYSFEKSADLHESLRKRLSFTTTTNQKPRRSLKLKNSSLTKEILSEEETSYSSEEDFCYDDSSDSTTKIRKNMAKIAKKNGKSRKMISLNTLKCSVGRPPKRSNEIRGMTCEVEIKQQSDSD
uniref:MBD domain-containing protein n=2 Tax=Oryza brachyantha TaxID=4533 RepID=J3KUK6_ORYBR